MKILMPLLLAFITSLSLNSYAADVVVGSVNCREWIVDRTSNSDNSNKYVDQSWVIGFLSGYSVATRTDFLDNIKVVYVFSWMDKFCATHPLAKIDDGALSLSHELIRKMK